jgi:hypothetical protein
MTVFTFSNARQNFASLLDTASKTGEVLIKRQDGRIYSLKQKTSKKSPLEVKGINTKITTQELIDIVRESRKAI